MAGEANAPVRDQVGHQFRRQRSRAMKLRFQPAEVLLVFWIEQHDTSLLLNASRNRMGKAA